MKNETKKLLAMVLTLVMALAVSGCTAITTTIQRMRGELIGNSYTVYQYDNYGNLVFSVRGSRIGLSADTDESGEPTSYVNITIDGKSWEHVGGTLVFVQDGVDMITDFSVPTEMESESGGAGLMAIDRYINNYANLFGRDEVVLVSSQNGVPVGLFQGNNCYTEVPADLPKTTLIGIDNKLVYIHRANVDIIPTSLFEN